MLQSKLTLKVLMLAVTEETALIKKSLDFLIRIAIRLYEAKL